MPLPKYIVRLTDEERTDLEHLIHTGKHRAAATLIHARILLKADVGTGEPGWDDDRMVEAIECSASTVYRVRQTFVEEGLTAALFRKKPTGRLYRKLDGEQEAQLIALACSTPPAGRTHWTMRLLADRLVELQVVDSIGPECVRTTLKKTRIVNLARGSKGVSLLDTRVEERGHGQDHATAATDASAGVKLPEPALSGVWGTALVCL